MHLSSGEDNLHRLTPESAPPDQRSQPTRSLLGVALEARSALVFASRLYGGRLIAFVFNFSADLIIGTLAGPAAAGAYRLATRMVFGVSEIWFQPIKTIAWVRFSSAVRDRVATITNGRP